MCSFVALKWTLGQIVGDGKSSDVVHPLHVLLLLHGLLEDLVVDWEHDDHRHPEGQGAGYQGVGDVGLKITNPISCSPTLLKTLRTVR